MDGSKTRAHGLFGGALRYAGLAAMAIAGHATAEFTPALPDILNYTFVFGDDALGTEVLSDYLTSYDATFPGTLSYAAAGASAEAYSDALMMGARASFEPQTNWSLVGAGTRQYFTVGSEQEVLLEWDTNAGSFSYLWVYEVGVVTSYLAGAAVGSSTGIASLTLQADTLYLFVAHVETLAASDAYARITAVPAPSVLTALAGLGLVARRRRRR